MINHQKYTANDFHPEVLRLFDKFVHGDIDRREFLSNLPSLQACSQQPDYWKH